MKNLKYLYNRYKICFTDKDASAKHDYNSVILAKSEVNQLIVFVQAFMQRLVNRNNKM